MDSKIPAGYKIVPKDLVRKRVEEFAVGFDESGYGTIDDALDVFCKTNDFELNPEYKKDPAACGRDKIFFFGAIGEAQGKKIEDVTANDPGFKDMSYRDWEDMFIQKEK
jgi:hypothetical protein